MKSRLQLDSDELRRLGYRIVDLLVEHERMLSGKPVTRVQNWKESHERLRPGFPERGVPVDEVLAQVERDILGTIMHVNHPRFFAFVPGPGNMVGALADALAAGFNVFAGTRMEGSGAAIVELHTIDWLREVCGLPDTAFGLFVSGGSVANLTALAVARGTLEGERWRNGVVYFSDQTHSSVERGLRVLGFAPSQMRKLASDESYRLPTAELRRQVRIDRMAGQMPICVVANAGTTNTGTVDPLEELADLCRQEGLWLHADGAYGAAAVLCEPGRRLLAGLERVDSLSLDPHKWLFQPFEIGCVLVRDGERLRETFKILPEYLRDVHRVEGVNFCDYGVQLTRSFRALKLWMSLRVFGVGAFREAMEHGFQLAEAAEARLKENAAWEIVSAASMAVVSFRFRPPGLEERKVEAFNQKLAAAAFADGFTGITTTALRGRTVIRMCTINPRTTMKDVRDSIQRLEELAATL